MTLKTKPTKIAKVDLGTKRQNVTAKVVSVKVIKEWSHNHGVSASYDVGLFVKLDNGYCFYTPKRLRVLEGGVRGQSGIGVGFSMVSESDPEWFVVEEKERTYDEQLQNYITNQEYQPVISEGDTITIKGTPVKGQRRLNRVKLVTN